MSRESHVPLEHKNIEYNNIETTYSNHMKTILNKVMAELKSEAAWHSRIMSEMVDSVRLIPL